MISTFSPLPSDLSDRILCYYINTTNQIQRARITNIPNWLFERIIFPKQRLLFEAIPDALLEIHACSTLGETLLNQIPCLRLRVNEISLLKPPLAPSGFEPVEQPNLVEE
ncbi:protein of unknown function DUF1830 [Leptolyngbyaceae cyanobacterium JSC-12]|nr:protein of unknown function DUF1830 [Leptolyngbyaceae cyanobacterium JSC-12]